MFKYTKTLVYPINITKKDLRMAKYLITQFGGPNGELAASMRYFSQKFTMPDDMGKALQSKQFKVFMQPQVDLKTKKIVLQFLTKADI